MSVQLSVFPQEGINIGAFNNPNYQYLVDAQIFSQIFSGQATVNSIASSPTFVQQQVNYFAGLSAGIQFNTWYLGGDSTAGISPSAATQQLLFPIAQTCAIQKVNNVFTGANYMLRVNVFLYAGGSGNNFYLHEYDGTNLVTTHTLSPIAPTGTTIVPYQYIISFSSNNPTLVLEYDAAASILVCDSIELINSASQPSTFNAAYKSGEVILDLYEDENIPLTLSIDDFTKVAEKVQSYSKSFQIPQTKRNKKAFDNIYDITRSYDGVIFNPYMKTQCVLKVDSLVVFEGYLRLIDVNDKEGEVSYNVNLYSESIALKDILEKRIIADIDFSELDHDYDYDNIEDSIGGTGLTLLNNLAAGSYAGTAGTNRSLVLKYPFCDWNHQFTYNSGNNPIINRLEDAFRPWINVKYIINRIFENTPFTWNSAFFDSSDFEKLYMDFNWGDDGMPVSQGVTSSNAAIGGFVLTGLAAVPTSFDTIMYFNFIAFMAPTQLDAATGVFTADNNNMVVVLNVQQNFNNTSGSTRVVDHQINATIGGVSQIIGLQSVSVPTGVNTFTFTHILNLNNLDTFKVEYKADAVGVSSTGIGIYPSVASYDVSVSKVVSSSIINTNRGELGQWDFLSGIIKMFNLVTLQTDIPNEIQFEPYSDVFIKKTSGTSLADRSVTHDWTYKIDEQDINLKPLTDLNANTIFKFEEDDDDYAFNVYKKATRHLYGSKVFDASAASLLTGNEEISAKPFASTIIKKLENYLDEFLVPTIYAYDPSSGSETFDNLPRILYDTGQRTLTNSDFITPTQNGVASDVKTTYRLFSHTDVVPAANTDYDFVFGEQSLFSGMGTAPLNNLFNLYWLPYFNELYNSDTRIMTIKVNLTPADINTFRFNDLVYVKQRVFRVNKIDYQPGNLSTVEFILIP